MTTVDELLKLFDPSKVDWSSPLPYALKLSAHLSTLKDLKGPEKMKLLQEVLTKAISTAEISEEARTAALRFVADILPMAVQAALAVSKGEVSFEKAAVAAVERVAGPEIAKKVDEVLAVAETRLGCFCRPTPAPQTTIRSPAKPEAI